MGEGHPWWRWTSHLAVSPPVRMVEKPQAPRIYSQEDVLTKWKFSFFPRWNSSYFSQLWVPPGMSLILFVSGMTFRVWQDLAKSIETGQAILKDGWCGNGLDAGCWRSMGVDLEMVVRKEVVVSCYQKNCCKLSVCTGRLVLNVLSNGNWLLQYIWPGTYAFLFARSFWMLLNCFPDSKNGLFLLGQGRSSVLPPRLRATRATGHQVGGGVDHAASELWAQTVGLLCECIQNRRFFSYWTKSGWLWFYSQILVLVSVSVFFLLLFLLLLLLLLSLS